MNEEWQIFSMWMIGIVIATACICAILAAFDRWVG